MSRLPTLTTPGRPMTASPGAGSGIPAPSSIRRPRSSLGPGASPAVRSERDPDMDQALKDVLRNRPPSSLSRVNDSDTPMSSGPQSPYLAPEQRGVPTPRTPVYRPKTPSSGVTPGSRPASRPSLAAPRASLATSTTTPAGRRTSSMASSTSTPFRSESRAGNHDKWTPAVGDRVRLPGHGYEGTLRYLGTTHIRDGIWAGVELEGAFKGRGRNDGTVDGHEYFKCAPNCGIFTLVDKLARPTAASTPAAGPSRPASVASHRSLASSYSASGRVTPAADRIRRGATTPSFGTRSVQARSRADDDAPSTPSDAGSRTMLGNSTANNAARAEAKITAGSRASKYLGMTAKQLTERTTGTTPTATPVSTPGKAALSSSTTTTPKAVKSLALSTSRLGRPSLGGLSTPKARGAIRSASEMMPPPPSPNLKLTNAAAHGPSNAALEEEIRELKRRNAELEEQVLSAEQAQLDKEEKELDSTGRIQDLEREIEHAQKEAQELRAKLSTSAGDMSSARAQADELQASGGKLQAELEAKTSEIDQLKREMELAAERAASELEAGMEAKREEVQRVEERAEAAEIEASEMKRLVDELTLAGNQIIELNESKQFTFECQIRELEEKLSKAYEDIKTAKSEGEKAQANGNMKRDVTAVEIDNETLTEQVKHFQSRIANLEEQLDEARSQAETDSEAWQAKYNKARDAEKDVQNDLERARDETKAHLAEVESHKSRIAELQGAVKENQSMLEAARAEIESMRAEASAASAAKTASEASETTIAELRSQLEDATAKSTELEGKIASMEGEITTLRAKATEAETASPSRRNGAIEDAEKSILGYHHIVNEMKAEVAQLRTANADLVDEIGMLKEENKLLHEISESDGTAAAPDAQELAKLRTKALQQAEALKEYEREVSELESLIESKIYHEDELESRVQELERERDRWQSKAQAAAVGGKATSTNSHSRTDSLVSNGSAASDIRCELCEGPHDLDACPVFAGTTLDVDPLPTGAADQPSPLANKAKAGKKWCNDCESSAHDTTECPMADDIF